MAKAKRVRAKGKAREDSESVDGHKDQTEAINRVINMKKSPLHNWSELSDRETCCETRNI